MRIIRELRKAMNSQTAGAATVPSVTSAPDPVPCVSAAELSTSQATTSAQTSAASSSSVEDQETSMVGRQICSRYFDGWNAKKSFFRQNL